MADIDYLARNHRVQDPELLRLDLLSVEPEGEQRVEIRTREHWRFRVLWAVGEGDAEPSRDQVLYARYLLVRASRGWQVEGWEPIEQQEAESKG